jgi:hypothetical protein
MEKVKLYFDHVRFARLKESAADLADYANTVAIPLLKAMEVPVTRENVLSTCRQSDYPRYYQEQRAKGGKFEKSAILEQIAKTFKEAFAPFKSKARRQSTTGEHVDCCHLNGDSFEVSAKDIEDLATVWLTDPKEIEARREHLELCEKLTDFVRRAEVFPTYWVCLFQVNADTGEITPNPFMNPYPLIAQNS